MTSLSAGENKRENNPKNHAESEAIQVAKKRMSNFLSTIFFVIGALVFAVACVYWDKGGYRNNWFALGWGVLGYLLLGGGAACAFYKDVIEPSKAVDTSPKERPYVFTHENVITKPLTGGESTTIRIMFENTGPGEVTVTMKNSTACFVVDGRRALKYAPYDPAATISFIIPPKHRGEGILRFPGQLTDADIRGLHEGRAKLYFFARGEYRDESGRKYPLDFRRKYDPEMPGLLAVCEDSITISD
jgi:hypothetical protein